MCKLTLAICCHNHRKYIPQMLESIFAQTLNPDLYKVWILFDACTDDSEEVFYNEWEDLCIIQGKRHNWLEFKFFTKSEKKGLANAKNHLLQYVDTKYVSYLDVDDSMLPQRLETQLNYLESNPSIDFCFTQALDRDLHGNLFLNCFKIGEYVTHEQIASRLLQENVLMHGSFMGKMSSLRDVGLYNESKEFLGMEDWELWIRGMVKGKRFYKINERLSIYQIGGSTER